MAYIDQSLMTGGPLGTFTSVLDLEAAFPAASNTGKAALMISNNAPLVDSVQPSIEYKSDGVNWRSVINGGYVDFVGLFSAAEQNAMRTDNWTGINLSDFNTKIEKIWDLYSYKTWLIVRGQCYIKCVRPLRYYGRLFMIGLTDGIGNGCVIYPDLSIDWQTTFPKRGVIESANYQYPTLPPNRTTWSNNKPDFIAQSRFQCIDVRCAHDSVNFTSYPNRVPDFGIVTHCANEGWTADRVNVRNARRANWLFSAYQSTPTLYNCGSWLTGYNCNTVLGDAVTRSASPFSSSVYVYADVGSVTSATILLEAATATDLNSLAAGNVLTIQGVNYTISSLTSTKSIVQNTMLSGTLTTARSVRQVTFSTSIAAYAAVGRQFSCGLLHDSHPDGANFATGISSSAGGQGSGGLIVLVNFSGDYHRDSLIGAGVNGTITAHGTKSEQNPSTYMAWGSANGGAKPKIFLGGYRIDHSGTDQSAIRCIGQCRPSVVSTGGQCNISHVKFIEDLTSAATDGVTNSTGGIGLVAWCADGSESTYIHRLSGQLLSIKSDIASVTLQSQTSSSYRSQWANYYANTNTYVFRVGASGSEKNLIEVDGANGTDVRLNVYNGSSVVTRVRYNNTGLGFFAATPVAKPTVTGDSGNSTAQASLLTALSNLGLITNSTTNLVQSAGRVSGILTDATAVVVALSTYGLVGVPVNLRVDPAASTTVSIETSTDGSTYTTLTSTFTSYSTLWLPASGETNITHVRFTRTAGAGTTSSYHVY